MPSYNLNPVQYLTNVCLCAPADHHPSAALHVAFRKARVHASAATPDVFVARDRARISTCQVALTGTVSDWFRNLEDMIGVATASGNDAPLTHPHVAAALQRICESLPRISEHLEQGALQRHALLRRGGRSEPRELRARKRAAASVVIPLTPQRTLSRAHYLSNVCLCTSPAPCQAEAALLKRVRAQVRASPMDLVQAGELATTRTATFAPTGKVSDWFRNLEDMAAMAFAAGNDHPSRAPHIARALRRICKALPELWAQMVPPETPANRPRLRPARGKSKKASSSPSSERTQFVPLPRRPVIVEGDKQPPASEATDHDVYPPRPEVFGVPANSITIAFAESNDSACRHALEAIGKLPTFQAAQLGGKRWCAASWPQAAAAEAQKVARLLSGCRNARVFVDGQELEWGSVFGLVPSPAQRQEQADAQESIPSAERAPVQSSGL